jgi:hypothetical protein
VWILTPVKTQKYYILALCFSLRISDQCKPISIWYIVVKWPITVSNRVYRSGRDVCWQKNHLGYTLRCVSFVSGAVVFRLLHESLIGYNLTLKPAAECLWTSNIFTVTLCLSTCIQKRVPFDSMQIILQGLARVQSHRDRLLTLETRCTPGICIWIKQFWDTFLRALQSFHTHK